MHSTDLFPAMMLIKWTSSIHSMCKISLICRLFDMQLCFYFILLLFFLILSRKSAFHKSVVLGGKFSECWFPCSS